MITTLLENGANPLIINSEEKTGSHLAKNDAAKMMLLGRPQGDNRKLLAEHRDRVTESDKIDRRTEEIEQQKNGTNKHGKTWETNR